MLTRCGLTLAVLLAACGDDDAPAPDAAVGDASTGPEDAGPLRVAPTDGTLALDFGVAIRGSGTSRLGSIAIDDGTGAAVYGGVDQPLMVYERTPWPEAGYTLFQALMPRSDGWVVLWFYCREGALTDVYSESTDGDALEWESANGTCEESDTPTDTRIVFDSVVLPDPVLHEGVSISGPTIEVGGSEPGWVELGAERFTVHPFEEVDCTECAMGGWRELHAMLVDEPTGRVCFGIFYLYLDGRAEVDLTYSLSLPDLSDPAGHTMLPASWSTD